MFSHSELANHNETAKMNLSFDDQSLDNLDPTISLNDPSDIDTALLNDIDDMLQLINNQDMVEFNQDMAGLFDPPQFTGVTPTQDLPALGLPHSIPSPPSTTSSSILSSSPHLDALLGPPIIRSSSPPDKAFHPPTFQQSPLAQVTTSTPVPLPRPLPAPQQGSPSAQAAQGLRQPKVDLPLPVRSPPQPLFQSSSSPASSPHTVPGQSPEYVPYLGERKWLLLQAQAHAQQIRINYSTQNGYKGEEQIVSILCINS
ncbi:sterol regulatory element-binding protein 1-like [Salvelinus sp. IW2-2015]|uniref:sterol regulatory element-binding protein 1-like n=1 Tax=Salvelinus sp. IW2-2015 TaxID=2691554 RepID=UPI0038D4EC0F